jgi:nicotinamide-nucleotide amidase
MAADELRVNTMSLNAEIIAVGTELLLGDIVNSNAAWISEELARMGVSVYNHTTVGDNVERIHDVMASALSRANVLIFTGGLGPTEDDLTLRAIAEFFNAELVSDPDSEQVIKDFFVARGMTHAASNLKQALRPTDAKAIKNPMGTAPGIAWTVKRPDGSDALILTFPGVPREMKVMWPQGQAKLRQLESDLGMRPQYIGTKSLHFFGIGESKLGDELSDLMAQPNPTVAPYVGRSEVRVRLGAKADSMQAADDLLEPLAREIRTRLADYYFGEGDTLQVEDVVGRLLIEQQRTLSVAESCTGGLVSSRLTDVAGSSAYTTLNLVTYSNGQKHEQLGVPLNLIETKGAVSPEVAEAMAVGMLEKSGSDIALSLTGVAGPTGGTKEKPVGLLYMGLAIKDGLFAETPRVQHKLVRVNGKFGRTEVKYWFSQYALHWVRQLLS